MKQTARNKINKASKYILELLQSIEIRLRPTIEESFGKQCPVVIESCVGVGEYVFVRGWSIAEELAFNCRVLGLTRIRRKDIALIYQVAQPKVDKAGFFVILHNKYGKTVINIEGGTTKLEIPAPEFRYVDYEKCRDEIIHLIDLASAGHVPISVYEWIGLIWSQIAHEIYEKSKPLNCILESQNISPKKISIIIPIYKNISLLEEQLWEIHTTCSDRAEIIVVVDSPADRARVEEIVIASAVSAGSWKVVCHSLNFGFAFACSTGVDFASNDTVIFMNSDVFPETRDWDIKLSGVVTRNSHSIVGCKLLYADGSIQHVGATWAKYKSVDGGSMWWHVHPMKGMADSRKTLIGVREVNSLTGALMCMSKHTYRKLGGFSFDYIIGDFEDSDICLVAHKMGAAILIDLDTVMVHLEKQSYPESTRSAITRYNCYHHTNKWKIFIEEMLSKKNG